jgi:hypothetical protein
LNVANNGEKRNSYRLLVGKGKKKSEKKYTRIVYEQDRGMN